MKHLPQADVKQCKQKIQLTDCTRTKTEITMFTLQAGSSSWKRNLLMLSNLSSDLKNELDEQRKLHFGLNKYLQLEEQVRMKIFMRLN